MSLESDLTETRADLAETLAENAELKADIAKLEALQPVEHSQRTSEERRAAGIATTIAEAAEHFGVSTRIFAGWTKLPGFPGKAGSPGKQDGHFPLEQIERWRKTRPARPLPKKVTLDCHYELGPKVTRFTSSCSALATTLVASGYPLSSVVAKSREAAAAINALRCELASCLRTESESAARELYLPTKSEMPQVATGAMAGKFSKDQHEQTGAMLYEMRNTLLTASSELSKCYGKTSKQATIARRALRRVDALRSVLDGQLLRDLGRDRWESENLNRIYYPGN